MNNKTVLIIIDMQNMFINEKNRHLPAKIRSFIKLNKCNYSNIIFFRFINKYNSNFVRRLNWTKCMNKEDYDTFICDELIDIANENIIFEKSTYSIFKSKDFVKFLDSNNIVNLDICGIDSDACILASLFDAFDLNYEFKVLTELVDTSSTKAQDINKYVMCILERNIGI